MSLFFRLIWTALARRWRPAVGILGPCRTPFRVWPTDLDVLRHVNNGRYLTILDLARVDLINRAGLAAELRRRGWYPVVVAETIRFRRSLKAFEAFEVETRVLGWDEKAFLLEQRFWRGGKAVAEAVIRARFLKRAGGSVAPEELLALADVAGPSPALPADVARWNADQAAPRPA